MIHLTAYARRLSSIYDRSVSVDINMNKPGVLYKVNYGSWLDVHCPLGVLYKVNYGSWLDNQI